MTTIEKNVTIPISRRLEIDLPDDMPLGAMKMTLTFAPLTVEEEAASEDDLTPFFGILANNPAFDRDSVELQREWRAEWDRDREREHDDDT